MQLAGGYVVVAEKLQEVATAMSHGDIHKRLGDALQDHMRKAGSFGYIVDVFGDDESGKVVYSHGGDLKKASYSMGKKDGKPTCVLDHEKAKNVIPITRYEEKSPVSEKESENHETKGIKLTESAGCEFLTEIPLSEAARATYPIKVISPGTGSTAHYPASVVEKAASLVKPGTLMFWNHATRTEESERPEGDLNNLAAIITKQGEWKADGPKGPGIYAEAKPMADYAQKVEERAPHIGLSIRAEGTGTGRLIEGKPELASIDFLESVDYVTRAGRGGMALAEAAREAGLLPEIQQGGDVEITEAKIKELIAAAVTEATSPLKGRALRGDATVAASRILNGVSFTEAQKQYVIDTVLKETIPELDGQLDSKKFGELVMAEARRFGMSIAGGQVRGLGPVATQEAEKKKGKACKTCGGDGEDEDGEDCSDCGGSGKMKESRTSNEPTKEEIDIFMRLGLDESQAKAAVRGRSAA